MRTYPNRTVAVINKGNTAIVVDDGCYCIRNQIGEEWKFSAWIFPEALEALKALPANPSDAADIDC